jgi:hypothetical protein
MYEMNADAIDGAAIVVEGGQRLQLSLPVELIFPVVAEPPYEVEIDAVFHPVPGISSGQRV